MTCSRYTCKNFHVPMHHLIAAARCWGPMLSSIHNLHYYLNLMW
jgi:queuine tRNA-ribosyltransferase